MQSFSKNHLFVINPLKRNRWTTIIDETSNVVDLLGMNRIINQVLVEDYTFIISFLDILFLI